MEFKSSIFIVARSFFYLLVAAFFVGFIVYWFTETELYSIIAMIVVAVIAVFVLVGEIKFKVVVEDDMVRFFKGSKLKHEYRISECSFRSLRKSGGNNIGTECKLIVTNATGSKTTIDCTPLGNRRYMKLLGVLGFN